MERTAQAILITAFFALNLSAQSKTEDAWRELNAGVALLEQYSPEKAIGRFEAALLLDPALHAARINLAIALYHATKVPEALVEARKAANDSPKAAQAHYLVGLAARQLNDIVEARAAFERVLLLDSGDTATRIQLARLCMETQEFARALELLQGAVAREPFNTTAVYSLGITLQRLGQRAEAKPWLQRFQELRNSGYATALGTQYLEAGRYAAAVTAGAATQAFDAKAPSAKLVASKELSGAPPTAAPAPDGTAKEAEATLAAARRLPPTVNLADLDADGDDDALLCGPKGATLWTNTGGTFSEGTQLCAQPCVGALAGDMNADGKVDVVLLSVLGPQLLLRVSDAWENATAKAAFGTLPALLRSGCLADADHDGDLDIALGTERGALLLRNNGDGTFLDITQACKLSGDAPVLGIAASDMDNGRDIDLIMAHGSAGGTAFMNRRDGTFLARPLHANAATCIALGEWNKDGFEDICLGGVAGNTLLSSDNRGDFVASAASTVASDAVLFADMDNDGWMDLVSLAAGRLTLLRGSPTGFVATSTDAVPSAELATRSMAAADVDADGDIDLVCADAAGRPQLVRNELAATQHSLAVHLKGRVSNRSGYGTKLDVRAGSLTQRLESGMSSPATRPATLHFGLGARATVDALRLLWPSGNVQAEIPATARARGQPWALEEVDRKPSSCPNLYTWNGHEFQFITDFMGGGEMGAWVSEGVRSLPDPEEYVRIPPGALQANNGVLEVRVTNELEEALFVDHLSLLAVDHPVGTEAHPDEGMSFVTPRAGKVFVSKGARPPRRAVDDEGRDQTAALARIDRAHATGFGSSGIRGFAQEHTLELEFDAIPEHPLLQLTGWTDYAFSSDTRRAQQSGLGFTLPLLEARNADGSWRVIETDIGIPVGRPQTMCFDLGGKLGPTDTTLRLRTNMGIHWNAVALAQLMNTVVPSISRQLPSSAELHWRGFSEKIPGHGHDAFGFDYSKVTSESAWKTFGGNFTREGEVAELLQGSDDIFVICTTGDELALTFRDSAFPQLAAGMTRTYFLHADGYSKEMDPNSATPDSLLPLPFHGMSRYPYGAEERFPMTPLRAELMERYNTRTIRARLPAPNVNAR